MKWTQNHINISDSLWLPKYLFLLLYFRVSNRRDNPLNKHTYWNILKKLYTYVAPAPAYKPARNYNYAYCNIVRILIFQLTFTQFLKFIYKKIIMHLFSGNITMFFKMYLFAHEKLKKWPSKVAQKYPILNTPNNRIHVPKCGL